MVWSFAKKKLKVFKYFSRVGTDTKTIMEPNEVIDISSDGNNKSDVCKLKLSL